MTGVQRRARRRGMRHESYRARLLLDVEVTFTAPDDEEAALRAQDALDVLVRKIPEGVVYRSRFDGPVHVTGRPVVLSKAGEVDSVRLSDAREDATDG